MDKKKKIILDLSTCTSLANVSKFVELISSFDKENFEINIIKKDWKKIKHKGVKFDEKNNNYSKADGMYLWDPSTHPDDYLENLVFPSFQNINFIKEISFFRKVINIFNPKYISYISCLSITSHDEERSRLRNYFLSLLKKNLSFNSFVTYILGSFEFEIAKYYKTKPKKFYPCRYKLSEKMNNIIVKNILKRFSNDRKKILISILWDEKKKFEVLDDRLKGGPTFKNNLNEDFEKVKKLIKKIDQKILQDKNYQFILASKKAVDWDNYLESDYIDLRNFEKLDLSLSQMIYICQELSSYSINWPSTFSIWITNCDLIEHLTFHDFKDTAVWCRKNLNNKNLNLFN